MPENRHDWHATFAAETFNASWDLLDLPSLTPAEEDKLLWLVFASRWHWDVVGQDEQRWIGDHQIANAERRDRHVALAWEALADEPELEDRAAIEAQLATLPEV